MSKNTGKHSLTQFQIALLRDLADGARVWRRLGETGWTVTTDDRSYKVPIRSGVTYLHDLGLIIEHGNFVSITDDGRKIADIFTRPFQS